MSTIIPSDIKVGEILKVLAVESDDEAEDEFWVKVLENNGEYLFVTYLSDTSKLYKGACVYSLEGKANRVDFENILEHHDGVTSLEDIGLTRIDTNMYVFDEEWDENDSDSEIYEESCDDEDEDEYDLTDGFVVPDTEIDGPVLPPPDAEGLERDWRAWSPRSVGESRFKKMVDRIEERARHQADDLNF
jgi:hypothetical protein